MSGQGVGNSPNAAFAASSARCHEQGLAGLSSSITELQELLDSRQPNDDLNNQGLIRYLCGNFNEDLRRGTPLVN